MATPTAHDKKNAPTTSERYLHFSLGKEDFAFPLVQVREVIGMPAFTPVPHAVTHFLGLFNLRGQIISALDMSIKLNITSRPTEPALVICDLGTSLLGVKVDTVVSVFSPKKEWLSDCPPVDSTFPKEFITGVYRQDKKLILILDVLKSLDAKDLSVIMDSQISSNAA